MDENLNLDAVKNEYKNLVECYSKIEAIQEEIKVLKESLKLEGVDPAIICKIAQSAVKDKKEDLVDKSQEIIDLVAALS
jgi:hypothetical protein